MSIPSVFSAAGGGQVFLYEDYSGGTYVDTMGVGSDFTQPNVGNRPGANTSIAPSGKTMLSLDGNDLVGDFGTGGIVDDADMPAWAGVFVEGFILYFLSTPNLVDEMRLIDQGGGSWGLNQFGAGILYRAEALSNSAMSATTRYCVTVEHNASTAVSTMTVEGTAQSDTGGNWDGVRDDFKGYKLIGAQGDLSKGFIGCFGCYFLGHATTWGSTERAALLAAMDEWWTGGGGGGGDVTCAIAMPGVEQRRAPLIVVPENLLILPRGLAEERRAELAAGRLASIATTRLEEGRASLSSQATYQATLVAPKAEERRAQVTSLSTYGVSVSGVGSGPVAPSASATASNSLAIPVAPSVSSTATLAVSPGAVTIAVAAILNRENSGTVTVLVGGGSPQTISFAAPAASELRAALTSSASYSASLPLPATSEQRSAVSSLATYGVALGLTAAESKAPSLTSQSAYSVAFAASAAEQRAAIIASSSTFTALLSALAPAERRASLTQTSTYGVALAAPASTQATSFITTGEFINITCAFVGIPSSGSAPSIIAVASTPSPAAIRWSFRPATEIVVSFGPATDIVVRQQMPATQITVVHRMTLHIGDVNDIDIEFRDNHTKELVDPSTVQVVVTSPSGAVSTYTFGSSANLTKLSPGKYRCAVPCTESERWFFSVVSPGPTAQGVESGSFYVNGVAA